MRFHQNGQSASIDAFVANGAVSTLIRTDWLPYPTLDWAAVKQVSNVRRHWEIHISRDYAEILINGVKVLATKPGAFHLNEDRYYLLWNVFSYNTTKANVPFVLGHWDNFGFDAPAGTTHDTVTHNYRLLNTGTDFMKAFGEHAPAQATLNIPDLVDGAAARRLMFTLQMEPNGAYTWSPSDTVSLNGTPLAIPEPQSNVVPAIPSEALVAAYVPYSVIIPLPDNLLVQGENQLVFTTAASAVHNIHVELDFGAAAEPAYTPPALAIGGAVTPSIPTVGPNAFMTQIGAKKVEGWIDNLTDPATFNPTVSGTVPINIEVHSDIALQSTGSNLGVKQIELLIDQRVVLTQRTNAEAAAPSVITTLNLDTRKLSNGTHEIYLRAYDTRCTPSIPDYHTAGAVSGGYFPLHIKVQNSGAAIAEAPSLTNHIFLPIATIIRSPILPATCFVAAAQVASQPFGLPIAPSVIDTLDRAVVRNDRRLLICDL
jgi:hypothetical protein